MDVSVEEVGLVSVEEIGSGGGGAEAWQSSCSSFAFQGRTGGTQRLSSAIQELVLCMFSWPWTFSGSPRCRHEDEGGRADTDGLRGLWVLRATRRQSTQHTSSAHSAGPQEQGIWSHPVSTAPKPCTGSDGRVNLKSDQEPSIVALCEAAENCWHGKIVKTEHLVVRTERVAQTHIFLVSCTRDTSPTHRRWLKGMWIVLARVHLKSHLVISCFMELCLSHSSLRPHRSSLHLFPTQIPNPISNPPLLNSSKSATPQGSLLFGFLVEQSPLIRERTASTQTSTIPRPRWLHLKLMTRWKWDS